MGDLTGTNGLIVGVANKRSLAWVIAKAADEAGAKLTLSYANERFAKNATKLAETLSHPAQLVPCDVARDDEIEALYQAVETEQVLLSRHASRSLIRSSRRLAPTFSKRSTSVSTRWSRWLAAPSRSWNVAVAEVSSP